LLRSALKQVLPHLAASPKTREVPLGFCCGGFSSTAGYVPGNEARKYSEEFLRAAWLPVGWSLPVGVTRFYPR